MPGKRRTTFFVSVAGLAIVAALTVQGNLAGAASVYRVVPGWGHLTAPLKWGEVPNVAIDPKGLVFVFTRAEPPVVELNAAGQSAQDVGPGHVRLAARHPLRSRRQPLDHRRPRGRRQRPDGLQVQHGRQQGPHDARHQGVSGDGPNEFNGVSDVAIAPNGDIFVADGHVNSRIVKFSKDGKFIKAWGRKGTRAR